MTKTPNFDEPKVHGILTDSLPTDRSGILITPGAEITVRYKGKVASVHVATVITPQSVFEGRIISFEDNTLDHEGLNLGDAVRFDYSKIEYIYSWVKEDQL